MSETRGRLTHWNVERGFGFVQCADEGRGVFCHISAMPAEFQRFPPAVGALITGVVVTRSGGRSSRA